MLLLRINTTSLALGIILTLGCAPKAPKTPCTTQDSFHKSSHYLLEINKPEKAFAIINEDAAKFPHRSLFPWSVFITISPKEMRGLGFPTSAEMQRLDKIEETIVEQLLKKTHLCYVGHITGASKREIIFYLPEKAEASRLIEGLLKTHFPTGNARTEINFDSNWENVSGLLR